MTIRCISKAIAAVAAVAALAVAGPVSAASADETAAPATTIAVSASAKSLDSDPQIRNSMLGYYEYIGAEDAVAWFEQVRADPSRAPYLRLGEANSATSIDNAIKAALSVKHGNTLRTNDNNFRGLAPLRISHLLTAMAETASDWMYSKGSMQHQNYNPFDYGDYSAAGQNIAYGYLDPYAGWYFTEKAAYDLGSRNENIVGHYLNLTKSGYTVTGYGDTGKYSAQNFAASSSDKGLSVDAYVASLVGYKLLIANYSGGSDGSSKPEQGGTETPVYRLYNPNSGLHHYTTSKAETDHLVSVGWRYENVSFTVSSKGYPVYRVYNPNDGTHHYTMSQAEARSLIRSGWNDEGIAWHVPGDGSIPVYRLYNPNNGEHVFTTSFTEYEKVGASGWTQESVAWIALK
ncbi:hypothetical protein JS528_09260 [Bifidobacterium sp. MA2]|uniref:SCP domain-containing protein n=1 Tax=Bifidobacterium santillanense TaxID=2809028 RepID=A0ABS5UR93_9BIFI|nr:CAP domain-containing protein [Bifidobacterium santillanense]MBT1173523.1 hypothetical protein [Bifidobacterium santillanense]